MTRITGSAIKEETFRAISLYYYMFEGVVALDFVLANAFARCRLSTCLTISFHHIYISVITNVYRKEAVVMEQGTASLNLNHRCLT